MRRTKDSLRTGNLLGTLAGAVSARLEERTKDAGGVGESAAAALHLVALFEGCSKSELSDALRLSHSATVRLLERLEQAGHVRIRDATDKRATSLHLTKSGRTQAAEVLQARCVALEEIVGELSKDQQAALDDIASTLLAALVQSPLEAVNMCRLCNEVACPPDACPVHERATELGGTTAAPRNRRTGRKPGT